MSRMDQTEMDGQFKKAVAAVKTLSVPFLQELQTVISEEIEKQKKHALRDAAMEVNKLAQRLGITPEELVRLAKTSLVDPLKAPAPARYRHPIEAGLEWSGLGRRPKWVLEWQAVNGDDLSAIEIKAA